MNVNHLQKPTLAETMQTLEAVVSSAPVAEIAGLLGNLERLKAVSLLRMIEAPRHEQQPDSTGKPTLLNAQQVAERLNVKKSFVYEVARQKKLKSVKLGEKYVMFTESAVEEFLTRGGA